MRPSAAVVLTHLPNRQPASISGGASAIPFAVTAIVISLFLPEELSFYIFGLRLTVVRLLCLLLAPVLIVKGIQKASAGRYRFVLSDLLVLLAGFWMVYGPANVDDPVSALNHAGPTILEFSVAYMAARILLSERGHALAFANLLCRTIAVVALVGALDPVTNHRFAHDLAAAIAAPMHSIDSWDDAYRLGLLRATGPIEHPILFGFICTIGILIAASVPIRGRLFAIGSCGLGAVLAFSSAPLQVMIIGFVLLAYNSLFSRMAGRWVVLVAAGMLGVGAAFVISSNPVGFIVTNLTFSPESGYYREWTWHMVTLYVSQSPWFGLGFGELPEEINHSIDSLWLVLSIQSGYPGAVLVGLSLMGAAPIGSRGQYLTLTEKKVAKIVGIVLFLTLYIAFTVHIWGSGWILTGLLIGLKAHLTELNKLIDPRRSNVAS